jgi:hypothetical protein
VDRMATDTESRVKKSRFYEEVLTVAEQGEIGAALAVEGLDEEVAALRIRLKKALKASPGNLRLVLQGMDVLRRMVATKYELSGGDKEAFSAFAEETLRRLRERGEGDGNDGDA